MSSAAKQGQINVGSKVFVGPNESDDVYDVQEVASIDVQKQTVDLFTRSGSSKTITVPIDQCYAQNPKIMSDLCGLHNIHEAGILANLEGRILQEEPLAYTYLNTVLVAVNPLKVLKNQPHFNEYVDGSFNPETPHPYAIAELAYQNLRMPRESEPGSQSIVISGESGAGKTETAKIVLSYLSNRSSGDGIVEVSNTRVSECILDSTPIFEEFGNAKTLRNNNSSRFGKFISLQFSPDLSYTLVGAFVTTYLLEKTRVCYQMRGERNYHIFYDLLSGAAKSNNDLCLDGDVMEYYYLNQSVDGAPEGGESGMFEHVSHSMEVIGVEESERADLWKVLSGILHLGNTTMIEEDTVEGLKAGIEDMRHAALAANMFGVSTEKLTELLTVRRTNVHGQEIVIKLHRDEASFRRDAVSKALYAALFQWIVESANEHLGYKKGTQLPFIGVLDIFGFESFKINGLEQILINFANEYLQNVFNKQVFEAELKLFKEENILCALDDCPDNLPCVQILSAKGGVLDILNAQCGAIQPSEDKFVRDLTKEHKTNNFFPPVHRKDAKDSFKILHFAGPVQYTVGGWLLKNSDPLPESMAQVFSSGSLKLVSRILRDEISKSQAQSDTKAKKVKSTTVSQAFVKSMKSLTEELSQTKCNFIRCIKPNPQMRPGIFNRLYVVDQLRCLGILATCEVLKAGMPTRVTYKELMNALGNLPPATLDLFAGQPEEVLIAASMWAFEVPADAYQLGRTRVFFKAGEISRVESMLKTDLSGPAGEGINERMKIALERRQKALEAVLGVEALMNKAKPGVDVASQLLEDVEDTLRQINRDFATSSDVMSKSITAASKDVKDRTEMTAALNKLKNDPKLSMAEEADSVISIAEEALENSREVGEEINALNLTGLQHQYGSLRDSARELVQDTRATFGDINRSMERVKLLHREATDGAKRCLLDYTLERTMAAETECEGLIALVSEIAEGGAAADKASSMNSDNDRNRETAAQSSEKVLELVAKSVAYLAQTSEQLKGVRAEMRKAESKALADKAAELAALGMAPPPQPVNAGGGGGSGGSYSGGSGGGGGGGGGIAISSETASLIETLKDKVANIEKHYGEQLRALVAKTKDLHRVVKHQQEQISALSAASNVTALPPIAPLASDDLNSPPPLPPTASDSEEPKPTPDVAESDTPKPTPDVADAGEEDVSQPTPDVAENSDELKPTPDVGGEEEEEEERVNKVTDEEGGGESVAKNNDDDEIDEDFYLKDEDDEEVTKKEEEKKKKKERESQLFEWQEREAELLARIDEQDKTLKENEERMAKTEDRMELLITQVAKLTRATGLGGGSSAPSRSQLQQPRPRRLNDEKKRREGSSSGSSKSGPSSSSSSSSSASSPDSSSPASGNSTAVAAAEPAESSTSSRLNLWANIRDRIFKASNADSRLLRLTIYDASFFDSARNMKIPLDAHIEIRNITTGQVEKTALVKNAYKPKFNEHFAFKTKQNANDMIMMKILEFDRVGHGSIFGSVALPLDGKHTLGSPIPMPIFDEGLNMKGVVRVAASWAPTYPRKVKVILQGIQDLPENSGATSVACKLLTVSGGSQMGNRRDLVDGGCANFDGEVFDQLTLEHENDHLAMEILLYAEESDEPVFLSKTDIALPSEGQAKDEVVSFTTHKGVPAKLHVKASWND